MHRSVQHTPFISMKYLVACLVCLVVCMHTYAQSQREVDSLQNLLRRATTDSGKIAQLTELADRYANVNPQKAITYYLQAYQLFLPSAVQDSVLKTTLAANLSSMYQSLGDSINEVKWLDIAISRAANITDADALNTAYTMAANHYSMAEQYATAIAFSQKLILLGQQAKDDIKTSYGYVALGNLYFKMGQQPTSIYNYKKALAYTVKPPGDEAAKNDYIQALEGAFIGLSQVYFEVKQYDSAIYYANEGLQQTAARNDVDGACILLNAKAYALQKLNRYAESIPYAMQALQLAQDNDITYHLPNAWAGLAMAYAHTGKKDSAMLYGNRTEGMVRKITTGKEDLVDIYTMWATIYEGFGDYKKAWEYKQKELDAYKEFRDNEVNKAINQNDIAFGTKQKEQQIETLNEITKRQRLMQWAIGIGLIITAVAAIGFWRSYHNKRKAAAILEQSNKEKEIFLKEIHHRVKNNLQIISSLLYLQFKDYKDEKMVEALHQAQQRIKSMALVHNKLYEKQDVVHVYLKEYINDLAAGILASNNPAGKQINIKVEENSNAAFSLDTSISIGLILNELITNSCKYAFANRQKGNIDITLEQADNQYKLYIADDGNGLPGDFEKKNSLGVRLVKNLARQMGGEANFTSNNGTVVTILFTENAAA